MDNLAPATAPHEVCFSIVVESLLRVYDDGIDKADSLLATARRTYNINLRTNSCYNIIIMKFRRDTELTPPKPFEPRSLTVGWEELSNTKYDSHDITDTLAQLEKIEGEDLNSVVETLGPDGVILATQIRNYDFGDFRDYRGEALNDRKYHPRWLGTQVVGILGLWAND